MRVPWLGDVLTDAGLRVATPVGDPIGRGRSMDAVYGVVGHDTVTPGWDDLRVARLLRDGHPDLSGPLSQLGVRPDGTFDWIADGRCNHNGYGLWGNDSIGIEVYCGGGYDRDNPDPWNGPQREAFVVGAAAILRRLGHGTSIYWNPRAAGHKETDPDRKIDPYGIDMVEVRADVRAHLTGEDDDMAERVPKPDWVPDRVLEDLVRWGVDDKKPTREPYVIWRMLVFQHRTIVAVLAIVKSMSGGAGLSEDEIARAIAERIRNG